MFKWLKNLFKEEGPREWFLDWFCMDLRDLKGETSWYFFIERTNKATGKKKTIRKSEGFATVGKATSKGLEYFQEFVEQHQKNIAEYEEKLKNKSK